MLTKFEANQKKERWKDTPFKEILKDQWHAPTTIESIHPIGMLLPKEAIILTLYNGKISERWLDESCPEGLLVRYENNQLKLHFVKDAKIERPIVIHYELNAEENSNIHVHSRLMIHAESGANGSILFVESGEGKYLSTPTIDLFLEPQARIEWTKVSLNSAQAFSITDFSCQQAANSHFHYVSYQSKGALVRSNIAIELLGEETYTQLDGLNIGQQTQHLAHVVDIDHKVANGVSRQQMKNILKDSSEGVFDGKIHVYPEAQKISADQLTRSLLLDDGARSLTIPRLEIYADDVRCTHGATIGHIEANQLFYLRSRGLDEHEAKKMLMNAYGAEIILSVENKPIQEWLMYILDADIKMLA